MSKCRLALTAAMLAAATPSVASAQPVEDDGFGAIDNAFKQPATPATGSPANTGGQTRQPAPLPANTGTRHTSPPPSPSATSTADAGAPDAGAPQTTLNKQEIIKILKEYEEERAKKRQGPKDPDGNCLFGPPTERDDKGAVVKEPDTCLTFEQTQPTIPNWLNLLAVLGIGTAAGIVIAQIRASQKEIVATVETTFKRLGFIEKQPAQEDKKDDKKGDKKA